MYRGFQDSRMVIDAAGAVPRRREASIGMGLHVVPHSSWNPSMLPDVERAAAYGDFLGLKPQLWLP